MSIGLHNENIACDWPSRGGPPLLSSHLTVF